MLKIQPQKNEMLKYFIDNIATGKLLIPDFQRPYVWDKQKASFVIDSILKGYPINGLVLWKSERKMAIKNNILGDIIEPCDSEVRTYLLDGQQRITTLYGLLTKKRQFKEICVDLNEFDTTITSLNTYISKNTNIETNLFPIHYVFDDLINETSEVRVFLNKYLENNPNLDMMNLIRIIPMIKEQITAYSIPFWINEDVTEKVTVALEVFKRINTSGTVLKTNELLRALLFVEKEDVNGEDTVLEIFESLCVKFSENRFF